MPDLETATETQGTTPERQTQDTAAQAAPGAAAADTLAAAGSVASTPLQQAVTEAESEKLAAARVAAQPPPVGETLLAGKYKTPQELERAYLEAQKKLSESGELKRKYEEREKQLAALTQPQQQKQGAASDWTKQWQEHPLSAMPDPRYDPRGHQGWVENTFTPHFLNDPAGTIQHFALPVAHGIARQVYQELRNEFVERDAKSDVAKTMQSAPEWSGGKTLEAIINGLSLEDFEIAQKMVQNGAPIEVAAELFYRRGAQVPMQAKAAAADAKDKDTARLAASMPDRTIAGAETPDDVFTRVLRESKSPAMPGGDFAAAIAAKSEAEGKAPPPLPRARGMKKKG